ncbi:MAG: Fic family protein [Parachlamydiaceae bacterium]|nr:Fic family protein [Parachlamydiaceae bacterium]
MNTCLLPAHSTQIMIDLVSSYNTNTQPTLQNFILREKNYDLAFCSAWEKGMQLESFKNSKSFLNALDEIYSLAMSHLPKFERVGKGFKPLQGRTFALNYYGLLKNVCSDEEGIKDIIRKIWIDQEDDLELCLRNNELCYVVSKDNVILDSDENTIPMNLVGDTRQETLSQIFNLLMPLYTNENGSLDPGVLCRKSNGVEREKKALKTIDRYFELINLEDSPVNKIRVIASTIRDLMQIHLYFDGNGRSLYILANVLFKQNNLQPFYPKNMCMFDGNSIEKMESELLEGQERFSTFFGSLSDLNDRLKNYSDCIIELKNLTNNHKTVQKLFDERNFNLLLRQSASNSITLDLLEFLLANATTLPIDIFSRGEKFGNALDIAKKYENLQGIALLEKYLV